MVITYGGLEFFKIQSGSLTLVFNPVSKASESKIAPPRFKTDIALISLNHPDFNGVENLSDGGAFIIDGPGEYEIKEIFVNGFNSSSNYEAKANTIYKVVMEGITLCFLGALGNKNIDEKVLSQLEGTEILFLPVGGEEVLAASDAYKLSVKIAPNIIIPMHYDLKDKKNGLEKFLKEEGTDKVLPIDKLTIKKNLLSGKEGEIVVLNGSNT